MTGNLSLLAPAMIAVTVASLVVGDERIYRSQLPTREDSPAHRDRFAFPLLGALPAGRAARPVSTFNRSVSLEEALTTLEESRSQHAAIVDEAGDIVGEVTIASLREAVKDNPYRPVSAIVQPFPEILTADVPLDAALDRLTRLERRWLPVVDSGDRAFLGAFDARALLRAYRSATEQQVRPLSPLGEVESVEVTVAPGAPAAGQTLATLHLPTGSRVLTIGRSGSTLVPSGNTTISAGDRLTVTVGEGQQGAILALFLG